MMVASAKHSRAHSPRASPSSEDFILVDVQDLDIEEPSSAPLAHQTPETLKQIKEWLKPTEYLDTSSDYVKHLTSHAEGTSKWIAETDDYRKWLASSEDGSIWIKATAGAGKSVLAAFTISQLTQEKVPVLFFFFRQIVAANHSSHSLVRDFICQLLKFSPLLQKRMRTYADDRKDIYGTSTKELWADLQTAMTELDKVFCVVDALDEMDLDQEQFLHDLVGLGKSKPASIKLLMTSRPLPRIEEYLKDPSVLQIRLDERLIDRDISIYVNRRLQESAGLEDDVRPAIRQAIVKKSAGSFLYSRIMMDELLAEHPLHKISDPEYLERFLNCLPLTLEDMYNGMLLDHSLRSGISQELQVAILSWATHSTRPLRLLELAALLDWSVLQKRGKDTKSVVRSACGPLLEILPDETISIIHHSFTEFLTDPGRRDRPASGKSYPQFPIIESEQVQRRLGLLCLEYMTGNILVDREHRLSEQELMLRFPFLKYAIKNWFVHIGKLHDLDPQTISSVSQFMNPGYDTFETWLNMVWRDRCPKTVSPLHVCAWAGMANFAKYFLKASVDVNGVDGYGNTALFWAVKRGRAKVVALLLKQKANPDTANISGLKPLHAAAQNNRWLIVRQLLEAGVSPMTEKTRENPGRWYGNATRTVGRTAFRYAVKFGCTESVREMMSYLGAKDHNTGLEWAVDAGKNEIVDLLLTATDVLPDPPDIDRTLLFRAASGYHPQVIRSLLDRGADPRKTSVIWGTFPHHGNADVLRKVTPLHALTDLPQNPIEHRDYRNDIKSERACIESFYLLVQAGAEINAVDSFGKTALHYAVAYRSSSIATTLVRLLVNNGADVMARDNDDNTPLHLVTLKSGSSNILGLLLSHGADMNARRSGDGRTPLHSMLMRPNISDIAILAPYVSDWNFPDPEGNTALHLLLGAGFNLEKSISELLKAGADPRKRNNAGLVPIHLASQSSRFNSTVLFMLLEAGADLEERDYEGRTALLRHVRKGYFNSLDNLEGFLQAGANLRARDLDGNGVLHLACRIRNMGLNWPVLRDLIEAGADPLHINHAGNTALHELCGNSMRSRWSDEMEIVILDLIGYGIDPLARNYQGHTAFHLLSPNITPMLTPRIFDLLHSKEAVNLGDRMGIRPVHIAATISEQLLRRLLLLGADPTAATNEGRTLLHIAARSRDSNIVGLVLELFNKMGQMGLVHTKDKDGWTALHDACRSGRPESVALLLQAGAESNSRDKNGNTPLHICADIEEEQALWLSKVVSINLAQEDIPIDRRGILKDDTSRPYSVNEIALRLIKSQSMWFKFTSEHHTIRGTDIVKCLVAYGADTGAVNDENHLPIEVAVEKGYAEVVRALAPLTEPIQKRKRPEVTRHSLPTSFQEAFLQHSSKTLLTLFTANEQGEDYGLVKGEQNFHLLDDLLVVKEYDTIRKLPSLGAVLGPCKQLRQREPDFMTLLAGHGYSDLFADLGKTIHDDSWINGSETCDAFGGTFQPYILAAVRTRLPNMAILKVIVEIFDADVNQREKIFRRNKDGVWELEKQGSSALHFLAESSSWWQLEAMRYLLDNGADTETMGIHGQTSLHIAIGDQNSTDNDHRRETVRLLLDHNANPNATDDKGVSCLEAAVYDIEIFHALIKAGADVFQHKELILFAAISTRAVDTIAVILEAGVSCNIPSDHPDLVTRSSPGVTPYRPLDVEPLYPLHIVASWECRTARAMDTAIAVIKLLLEHGADPWQLIDKAGRKTTILHEIVREGRILYPFLKTPLDLERRDAQGQTLLLAACTSNIRTVRGHRSNISFDFQEACVDGRVHPEANRSTSASFLVEMGAKATAKSMDGNNALHCLLMARSEDEEVKETFSSFIEKAPSLIHQANDSGRTPIFEAILSEKGRWYVGALLKAGVDIKQRDLEGNLLVHFIAPFLLLHSGEWLPLLQELLCRGVSINDRNNMGETPVFRCIGARLLTDGRERTTLRVNGFEVLKALGADLFAKNNERQNLLHKVALSTSPYKLCQNGDLLDEVEMFQYLIDEGLDPMAEDQNQRTALDIAAACGASSILKLFKVSGKAENSGAGRAGNRGRQLVQ